MRTTFVATGESQGRPFHVLRHGTQILAGRAVIVQQQTVTGCSLVCYDVRSGRPLCSGDEFGRLEEYARGMYREHSAKIMAEPAAPAPDCVMFEIVPGSDTARLRAW